MKVYLRIFKIYNTYIHTKTYTHTHTHTHIYICMYSYIPDMN
jgi:hypothetical protein